MSPRAANTCPVLTPDYSTTRRIAPWMNLPRFGTAAERAALDPAVLWTLTILEGSWAAAQYAGTPWQREVTIKNSTQASTTAGEC